MGPRRETGQPRYCRWSSGPTTRSPTPKWSKRPNWPVRRLHGCCRPSSATGWSSATATASTAEARCSPPMPPASTGSRTSSPPPIRRCRATSWADVEVPPHCAALGKAMYAFDVSPLPTGRLERRTEHTLGSRKELTDNLAEVRERGFAIVHEEFEVGLDALAAPVFGIDGDVVAAVGISGPTMRIADHHEKLG